MKFLIVTLCAAFSVAAQSIVETDIDWSSTNNETRRNPIFGGLPAYKSQFPYQVALLMTLTGSPAFLCGGSLISNAHVLTSAHCTKDASSAYVILGAVNIFNYEPTQVRMNVPESGIFSHPEYDPETMQNDVGIIELPSAVIYNNAISPIDLPEGPDDFIGYTGVISGWGDYDLTKQTSPFLRFVNLKVIENSECRNEFPDIIFDSTICARDGGNVGTCHGDSGGPFTIRKNGLKVLVGVTSYGSAIECGHGHPTAFARVSSFIPWIQSKI